MTVVGSACAALILLVAVVGICFAGVAATVHRARAAADLSALGAAARLQEGAGTARACVTAAELARQNGARLVGCSPSPDLTVLVRCVVVVPPAIPVVGGRQGLASARAGPAEPVG